jgi:hypothetical protein
VNTQSIASASGFALLLPSQIETLLSVEADEISKPFGQCFKQQRQRSVNRFIWMSMVAILASDSQTQPIGTNPPTSSDPLAIDHPARHPTVDRAIVALLPPRTPLHAPAFHHHALSVNSEQLIVNSGYRLLTSTVNCQLSTVN